MPFVRPSLDDLVTRIQNDFNSRLALAGPVLRRAVIFVTGRVLAGAAHMLHGNLQWISKQIFPDQSDTDILVRQGSQYGVTPNGPAFATGHIIATGTNGSTIGSGETLTRADGMEYKTTGSGTISAGTASIPVTAVLAAGAGDCDAGTVLTFVSPDAGIAATATVDSSGLSGGTDPEDLDTAYRGRVLARMSDPPHGGSAADYVAWALQVSGVTRAWVYPQQLGAGTVVVYFMRDNDISPIPDSGEVATVQNYINALRPVTATLTVLAPTASPLNFTLHIVPDTTDIRAAVQAELADLIAREAVPGGTLPLSQIRTAIGIADGLTDYTLSSPAADVTHTTGQITTMGTIAFV